MVEAEWHGAATQQDLRKAVVAGLELHERTRCAFRLNYNTGSSGPWSDSVTWLEKEWLPRFPRRARGNRLSKPSPK
ncbi:hypothetical protein [Rufibacter radiotolerans]|nr:hypothetical protein [Rufibacter radiotolerans]